jgi:hypothetical protein
MKHTFALLLSLTSALGAAAGPARAAEPVGVLEAARESLFGDVYAQPSTWQALTLTSLFSEGWNEPWASPPPGSGGAPRQGWINAWDGVFYRLGIVAFSFAEDVANAGQYASNATVYTPFSRRFEIQTDVPFFVSNESSPSGQRHTRFGDFTITPRILLQESENWSNSFDLAFRTPTGDTRNGNDTAAVTPTWNFWGNPWQGLVLRGGAGIIVPYAGFDGGARTALIGNLAAGYYFTQHDKIPFGDLVGYLSMNINQPVDDRGAKRTILTFTPGFRTHLGANWYLLGGIEVPVTNPEPFDYQLTSGLMKVF